jgi:hypothetical protein
MDIIKNNPYRIIGILVGTSTKDEHNKIKKIKMYIDAEQEVPEDFSFPILGELHRTLSNVNDAVSKLTLNKNRVEAALFWFYNGNEISDEPTFDAIKSSKEEAKEALKVWVKLANSEDVTDRNASAFQNISTIHLLNAFKENGITKSTLEKGILLKLKFLESNYFENFLKLSADTTYKVTSKEIQSQFLNEVYLEIEKKDSKLLGWFLETLSKTEFAAKKEYLDVFISKPIDQLKIKIDETKEIRKRSPAKGYTLGTKLYKDEKENLLLFENILGKNNIQYSSIADKLAGEILQCGVSYFKNYKDTSTDPAEKSMELFKIAKRLAVGNVAKQKIDENIENLNEWVEQKPERDKHNLIKSDLNKLIEILNRFDNKTETIENAKILLTQTKPHLLNIKNILTVSDELYLKLSTRVAGQAQSYIIEEVNNAQQHFDIKVARDRYSTILILKTALKAGWDVTNLIEGFDMETDYKINRFIPNKKTLRELCAQLDISTGDPFVQRPTPPRPIPPRPIPPRPIPPTDDPDNSIWSWVIGIVIIIILINACN